MNGAPLASPFGKGGRAKRGRRGIPGCNTLSVTFGDGSPKGRAKGQYAVNSMLSREMERIFIDTLH